jgi:ATP-dependent helicase/nuclease subunit A
MTTRGSIDFVAASAGSGKTWRIVTEVVDAIVQGTVRPEAVVATTFSRRAATALRDALRQRLLDAGRTDDALRLEGARIGTVHALCGTFLQQFALDLGRSPDLRVLDEPDSDALLRESLEAVVTPAELDRFEHLRSRLVGFDGLRDAARLVTAARANHVAPESFAGMAGESIASLDALLGPVAASALSLTHVLDGALQPLVAHRHASAILSEVFALRDAGRALPWALWLKLTSLDLGASLEALVPRCAWPRRRTSGTRSCATTSAPPSSPSTSSRRAPRRTSPTSDATTASSTSSIRRTSASPSSSARRCGRPSPGPSTWSWSMSSRTPRRSSSRSSSSSPPLPPQPLGGRRQAVHLRLPRADPDLVTRAANAVLDDRPPETLHRSWRSRPPLVALTSGLFAPPFAAHGTPAAQVFLEPAHPVDDPALGPRPGALVPPAVLALRRPDGHRARASGRSSPTRRSACATRLPRALRRPGPQDIAVLAHTNDRCRAIADALAG